MPDNQPVYILSEDSKRSSGKDAQRNNILAAKAVAEAVRTTLGPKGMDKLIVDSQGNFIVTNDGATILKEMQIEHPIAKMVVEVAKTQENSVGDGTTTAVILAGELLKKAEELLDQGVHPTVLAKGYRLAEVEAQKLLYEMAEEVSINDKEILKNIAVTAMTGKVAESGKEKLSGLVVEAVRQVIENQDIDLANIKIEKSIGENSDKSRLIRGIVIDKEVVHPQMPKEINKAKIALLDFPLELKNTEIEAKIQITDPSQLNLFFEHEENMLKMMVERIKSSGATVLICQKGIDDLAQHFLSKEGILAARRVKRSDIERLAKATGAKIVSNIKELSSRDLGYAGKVVEKRIGGEEMIFIEECQHPRAVTLLISGGTPHVAEEVSRAVTDSLGDIIAAIKDGKVVGGAGAVEIKLSKELLKYSERLQGREQLAVKAFAHTLEIIPRTLAENSGLDSIDTLVKLKSAAEILKWPGINVFSGEVIDSWKEGILEPLKIKTQALSSAAEVAEMILRIDDVILAAPEKLSERKSLEDI